MDINDYMLFGNLPSLDLHGYDRETARVAVNDYIRDSIKEKNEFVLIIHGIGTGVIRKATKEVLTKNKNVINFKTSYFNQGSTVVQLKIDK